MGLLFLAQIRIGRTKSSREGVGHMAESYFWKKLGKTTGSYIVMDEQTIPESELWRGISLSL